MRKVPRMLLHGGFLPLCQPSEGKCNSVAICAKTGLSPLRRCQHCPRRWWLKRRGRGGMGLAGSAQHAVGAARPHVAPCDDSPRHVLWPRIPLIVLGHQAAGPFLQLPCSKELFNRYRKTMSASEPRSKLGNLVIREWLTVPCNSAAWHQPPITTRLFQGRRRGGSSPSCGCPWACCTR